MKAQSSPRNFSQSAKNFPTGAVLIVDGEPLLRWAIGQTLVSEGYDVHEARDGTAALRALEPGFNPDVVLFDFTGPDRGDRRALARLHDEVPDGLIIIMTADDPSDVADEARGVGAVAVLQKPFDVSTVPTLLECVRDQATRDRGNAPCRPL
jgi:DNA-binding NtrC family response regulator